MLVLATVLSSQSTGSEPLSESIRGGAGSPVVVFPEVRARNLRAEAKYERYADGLFVLKLFRTLSADGTYRIEVWNLLVGPGKATGEFELPGTAILLLRAGNAQINLAGEREIQLDAADTTVVPENSRIRISNRSSEHPVNVRATLFTGVE
ncbi:MAG TPA: hypothetical protein VE175_09650 [Woeseiaceae bacterium]|nr:hypothetical protein [Woeseiaceae bacterium]